MRIKEGFVLREFLDKWVAVYVGEPKDHPGMVTMNKTGAFLWKQLQQPTTREMLLKSLLERYAVAEELAQQQVDMFLQMLRQKGILEETE